MDTDTKIRLAHSGDMGVVACAIRLKGARIACGLNQTQLADRLGLKRTTNISNMEKAQAYPNREIMSFFYREYRIDFNFLLIGHFSQLPGDVQDALFPALATANSEWDQREG